MPGRFYIETLGCPKNQVDSDKLAGMLWRDGLAETEDLAEADLVVVNTCAFIEAAREESIETILSLAEARPRGARLVVTGCLAERFGGELAQALPEVDQVAGFGVPIELTATRPSRAGTGRRQTGQDSAGAVAAGGSSFDLLELARPAVRGP
jgi:ribosomal protein S12 methylthiotransferase